MPDIPRILIRGAVITRFNRVVYIVLTMQNIRYIIQSRDWFSIAGVGYIFPFCDTDNKRSSQPSIIVIQFFSFDGRCGVSVSEDRGA